MKFKIDPSIFEKFSGLTIGVVVCRNVNNSEKIEEIQKEMTLLQHTLREKYTTGTLSQHPNIETWRKAYSAFGAKPKENKSSVENLYRLVLQGVNLRPINTLVDSYNLISLKHMVPVGGEDIDKIEGDIVLTFAGANEPTVLLLGDKEARAPHVGEVIYKDAVSAICRRWNWREADRTKFTTDTKNCFLVIEGLLPVRCEDILNATSELQELVVKYCGGMVKYYILDEKNYEIEL